MKKVFEKILYFCACVSGVILAGLFVIDTLHMNYAYQWHIVWAFLFSIIGYLVLSLIPLMLIYIVFALQRVLKSQIRDASKYYISWFLIYLLCLILFLATYTEIGIIKPYKVDDNHRIVSVTGNEKFRAYKFQFDKFMLGGHEKYDIRVLPKEMFQTTLCFSFEKKKLYGVYNIQSVQVKLLRNDEFLIGKTVEEINKYQDEWTDFLNCRSSLSEASLELIVDNAKPVGPNDLYSFTVLE